MPNLLSRFNPRLAAAGAALFVLGGAAGGAAALHTRPNVVMAPVVTTPIARLASADGAIVSVRGTVAETFGPSFVVADATGRVLIDAGPRERVSVTAGEPLLIQGRVDREGRLHADYLVGPDRRVVAIGRPHGPGRFGPGRPGPGRGPHPEA